MDDFTKWLEKWIGKNLTYTNFMRQSDEELAEMLVKDVKKAGFKIEKASSLKIVNSPEPGGQWSRVGDTDYG